VSSAADETAISEISIAPDGRVYVFGASAAILEIMGKLDARDQMLRHRIEHARRNARSIAVDQTLSTKVEDASS
jgi:hypothetical protein